MMNTHKHYFSLFVVAGLVMGCTSESGVSSNKRPALDISPNGLDQAQLPSSQVESTPADDNAARASTACPGDLPGAPMVQMRTPRGGRYCMDAREVSQKEYFEFLDVFLENPSLSAKPKGGEAQWALGPGCSKESMLVPDYLSNAPCSTAPEAFSKNREYPDNPVACVSWCNAYAYCAWAGKRLCGGVGGGQLSLADASNADASEYYNACSQGGKSTYAYGNTHRPDVSSAGEINYRASGKSPVHEADPANASTDCHGQSAPYDGVANVGCNVAEWQNTCRLDGASSGCLVQGLVSGHQPASKGARCDAAVETGSSDRLVNVGFRCCHD